MIPFKSFCDKKERWSKHQLHILKKVLDHQKLKSEDHTKEEEPYLFVKSDKDLSFDGIRIYKIGDCLAYRVQKESDTHPYGSARMLNIEAMWSDFVGDDMNEEKAGKRVMEAVAEEIKKFFEKSLKAEQDLKTIEFEKKIKVVHGTADFTNQINTKI